MVSKIEAAERMAEAISEFTSKTIDCSDVGQIKRHAMNMHAAMSAYRSASVPSDEELGVVAQTAYNLASREGLPFRETMQAISAAVRDWVQRDGLTDEEREWLCRLAKDNERIGHTAITASILRKLGREPEPVWSWKQPADGECFWSLDCGDWKYAHVDFTEQGIAALVWTGRNRVNSERHRCCDSWSVAEAKAWCEEQLREANLKGATDEQD